ncbi:MAG: 3-hydroxyacyl-CoA dehydrogenase NAD-binding domain-containing protein [Ferruginibacter sp.]
MIKKICVAGAGTMGSGIALVCAQHGFDTLLFDVDQGALDKARNNLRNNLNVLLDKKKISAEEADDIFQRLSFVNDLRDCVADVFIEAIIERREEKTVLFNELAKHNNAGAIFATNTSSLSISEIQAGITEPGRVIGMHFFNPAPVMKLVEVVQGVQTNETIAQQIYELCKILGKTPVLCKDAPGFIVNRVARHYYLEAMKIAEAGIADIPTIDGIMEASGFKMGPFKLMDLIGIDINLAVSKSIYEAFNKEERFKPSPLQQEKVAQGELGKKTGKGFYSYPS